MAFSSSPSSPLAFRVSSVHSNSRFGDASRSLLFFGTSKPSLALLRTPLPRSSSIVYSRRRKNSSATTKTKSFKDKTSLQNDDRQEDDIDEDAIEALFSQLEEDLKNDNLTDDEVDDELTEEDLARLEQELEDALVDGEDDELSEISPLSSGNIDSDDDADEEERPPRLKNWQVRRLASALKIGRRKVSIKNLAAELGLDRALVLELLRDPPPNLLLMCASLPDKVTQTLPEPEVRPEDPPSMTVDVAESEPEVKVPVHVMRTRWSMQKRLKKVHVETLERVYSRTKRPTNAMISSIVHVTNLPSKKVVKWFEDRRVQDGVPANRLPFRRSMPETIDSR